VTSVHCEIQNTNNDPGYRKYQRRNIRVDQRVQIVEKKTTPIRLHTGTGFQPILQQSQGTGPGKNFHENSPS
jgi:hypothetical protein